VTVNELSVAQAGTATAKTAPGDGAGMAHAATSTQHAAKSPIHVSGPTNDAMAHI
jgi:hypothetical protein